MHAPKPPQRDHKDVSLKDNLPGYQAKTNILKQIDDAASQFGGSQMKARSTRNNFHGQSESKRTAAMILQNSNNGSSLKGDNLQHLNNYNHNKTLLGTNGFKPESLIYNQTDFKADGPRHDEDLRSLRSEYDYTNKRKFVDVLGSKKKSNGLQGLLQAEKNLQDNASQRTALSNLSKRSTASSKINGRNKVIDYTTGVIDAIPEERELEGLTVIGRDGRQITLNPEQIAYLQSLNLVAENQDGEPAGGEVDYGMIENMDPFDLQQLKNLGEREDESAGLYQVPIYTNKKLYPFHYHQNSEDYKNLGNLHRENRTIEYYPQDQKPQFQTKPVIVSNKKPHYDFEQDTGLAASHRLAGMSLMGAANAAGRHRQSKSNVSQLAGIRRPQDELNRYTKVDPMTETYQTVTGNFPKTTNQDFLNAEPFIKAQKLKGGQNKSHNKKATVYNAYVNAMFNSGVFTNPGQDQC